MNKSRKVDNFILNRLIENIPVKKFFQPASNTTETLSPTSLLDLVNNKLPLVLSSDEISNRKRLIKNLIDTLHSSHPSRLATKNSGYFSQKYNASMTDSKELLTNRMTIAISEKLFDQTRLLISTPDDRVAGRPCGKQGHGSEVT